MKALSGVISSCIFCLKWLWTCCWPVWLCVGRDLLRLGGTLPGHNRKSPDSSQEIVRQQMSQTLPIRVWAAGKSEDTELTKDYLETLTRRAWCKIKKNKIKERKLWLWREKEDRFGDFFPPWRFNVHLKRTFHCSVCVHYTCGFVTIDIKPNLLLPPLRLCLHVCMCFLLVGNRSFPLFVLRLRTRELTQMVGFSV